MRLALIVIAVLAAVASVHGGVYTRDNPGWMLVPGTDGRQHIALLRGYVPRGKAIDPINDVKFYLYTRSNRNNPVQIFVGDLGTAPYVGSKNSKFIAHGYTGSGFDSWVTGMKNNFLDDEDCNVIAVDWQNPAQGPLYNNARNNVQPVGEYVGEMYAYLNSQGGASGRTHCIGHSLGSHVCGFSGKVTANLGRITGMDPALPLFSLDAPNERLDVGDANYVHIIHTCGGWLGFGSSIGHADFYPNGGTASQPGCGTDITGDCSHGRSHEFFSESIGSSNFVARRCISWDAYVAGNCNNNEIGIMGNPSDSGTRGDYYLTTNASPPYAQG